MARKDTPSPTPKNPPLLQVHHCCRHHHCDRRFIASYSAVATAVQCPEALASQAQRRQRGGRGLGRGLRALLAEGPLRR